MSHHGLGPKLASGETPVSNPQMVPTLTAFTVDGNKTTTFDIRQNYIHRRKDSERDKSKAGRPNLNLGESLRNTVRSEV